MELKVSSLKAQGLSPSDCLSDPEEKEISDDDDDDRNHKHRRRETRSQSLEGDLEQVLIKPFRRRNKHFENGHPYRENDSQSSETWKNYNVAPLEKDLSARFEKRRPGQATFPRALNRVNQSFSAEIGPGRGRGRECGSWNQRDPRFSSVDIASQLGPQGSGASSLFAGRGLPNVSNSQSASWGAFGLIPGMPNGGMETIHSLSLQGTLRPSISPSLSIGIPRQRCRDFEERGFCLRGDMCPMEHGVNRIVVEDVQSLSQFNLPVSLPSAHLLGTASALPSVNAPSSSLINSKSLHSKSSKPGMAGDGLGMNGVFTGSAGAGGADFYDPDQPLWTSCPESSTALLGPNSCNLDETESLLDAKLSDHRRVRLFDGPDNEHLVRSSSTTVGSQSTSSTVWGRIGVKSKSEMKEKNDSTIISSNYIDNNEAMEDLEPLANRPGAARQGKLIAAENVSSQAVDTSLKTQGDTLRNTRKPSQKALRTLFVNGIPQKDNKREALLLHFKKFGEVIDIYIPLNSERAFIQFSKREEAEAALRAPDAVMGNRFIKLWWANRDNIPEDGTNSGNSVSVTPHGLASVSFPPHLSVAHRGKDNHQSAAPKISVPNASVSTVPSSDHSKPMVTNSPKGPPHPQKKMENLELLKEELRKKQELLDQKRNDFRRQLDKLEKHATGKAEVPFEQAAKRHKPGTVADVAQTATPSSADSATAMALPLADAMAENKYVKTVTHQSSKPNAVVTPQEPSSLKHSIRPLAPAGAPFVMSRFKLDNRPTGFKIIPPLPTGLANVAVLKEHFSAYGELSAVELEGECTDPVASKNCSAHVSFTTRRSAERAFMIGKCWQGHNLQFTWVASSNSNHDMGLGENSPSASKVHSDGNLRPAEEAAPVESHKVAASGNLESENLERKESGGEHMKLDEDQQSSSSAISCEKHSPKGDVC